MIEPGDRVELTGILPGQSDQFPIGLRGNVTHVEKVRRHWDDELLTTIEWDNGRSLVLRRHDPLRMVREGWTMNDITTRQELADVPVGAVIIDRNLKVWKHVSIDELGWQTIGDNQRYAQDEVRLSARTLY